jgi:hypothetical protein
MKKILLLISLFIILLSSFSFAQQKDTDEYPYIINATADYYMPVGSLADRFEGTIGGTFYFGKQISDDYTWLGKIEYFKYTEVNSDNLNKSIEVEIGDETKTFSIPLTDLNMEMEVYGFGVETRYNLLRTGFFESELNLGFGFYYWDFNRDAYLDSVSVDTSGAGDLALISVIDVPENNQKDWSGAINLGIDAAVKIYEPVWFYTSVNYKLIIGELWPALALDMESVSGMQMLDIKGGIKIKL